MRKSKSREKKEEKTFDYDNIQEIEQRFEQFSENYRNSASKLSNAMPQMSLIKSILKKKGPTLGQQVQSIAQLSDLKNYFLSNCESKISIVEKLSSTRSLADNPLNFVRSQTVKNSIILKGAGEQSQINNDGRVFSQQQQSNQNKSQSIISFMDNSQIVNETFSRKNKKNLSFQLGQSMVQESSNLKKQLDQSQLAKTANQKQSGNADNSLIFTPVTSPRKLQNNSMADIDSGMASTEVLSPSQSNLKNSSRQVSLSNFSSLIFKGGEQTPVKAIQHNSQTGTPTMKDEQSMLLNSTRQKAMSLSNQSIVSPLKIIRERQRGNTIQIRDLSAPTPNNISNKKSQKGAETPQFQRNNMSFGTASMQQMAQPQTPSQKVPEQNQSSSAYSELLSYKERIRKDNRICQLIGQDLANFAIASLILIQHRDKKESETQDITQKFLSAFGINRRALDSMRKEEEKREYVVKQIMSQLRDQYTQWQTKSEAREKEIQKSELSIKAKLDEQIEREKAQKDQFRWLKINTFYSELENNLKSMIVMKINNFYNQNFLLYKIDQNKNAATTLASTNYRNNENNNLQTNNLNTNQIEENINNSVDHIQNLDDTETLHLLENFFQNEINQDNQDQIIENKNTLNQSSRGKVMDTSKNLNSNRKISQIENTEENQNLTSRKRGQTIQKNDQSSRNIQQDANSSIIQEYRETHVVDEASKRLLYIQINQNEQRKPSTAINQKDLTITDTIKIYQSDQQQQKPLQNLYNKIKPKTLGENQQQKRSQSSHTNINKGKFNPEALKETYNSQLNKYIAQKQSVSKGVKLQEQIDNCLKHGQTISQYEQEAEYRWLNDNMVKGLSKQEFMDKQQRVLYDNYYWNQETEDIFIKKRNQLQHRNFQSVKSSNFSELTTYEFMRLFLKNTNMQDINRENMMKRYQQGDTLSEEQMEFLAATNQLLNKFIDKNFMKDAISILESNNIVNTFELILAENILKSYGTVKNVLYNHRETFLSHKNEYTRQQYDEKAKRDQEYEQFLKNLEIHKKKSKMYQTVLKYFEKQNKLKQERLENTPKDDTQQQKQEQKSQKLRSEGSNLFSLEFGNSTEDSINIMEIASNQKKKAHELTHPRSIEKIMKSFNYHPPTKVILVETETLKNGSSVNGEQRQEDKTAINKSLQNVEKLRIRKIDDLMSDKSRFTKFYSGGPAPKHKNEINERDHLRQILKIQSFFRVKLAKNIVKQKQYIQYKYLMMLRQFEDFNETTAKNISTTSRRKRSLLLAKPTFASRNNSPFEKRDHSQKKSSLSPSRKIKDFEFETPKQKVYEDIKKSIKNLQKSYYSERKDRKEKQLKGRAERLIEYVRENNIYKIKQTGLEYKEGEVLLTDKKQNTALYYAVQNSNCVIAKYLLEKGANVNQQCQKQNTPMHIAFKLDDANMIFLLLDYHPDLNVQNYKGYTPLGYAKMDTLQRYGLEEAIAKKVLYPQHNIPSNRTTLDNNKFIAQRESQNFEKALIIEQGMQTNFAQDQYRDSIVEHTPQRNEKRQSSIKLVPHSPFISKLEFSPDTKFNKSSFRSKFPSYSALNNFKL